MIYSTQEQDVINQALRIIEAHYHQSDLQANSPDVVKHFCQLKLAHLEHEVFCLLLLNNQNQLIRFVELFRGTIDSCSVYPREVIKEVLSCRANAVILAHNHPSGISDPSQADMAITRRLQEGLQLLDVRVLDHIIVGKDVCSLAEKGLL